VKSEVRGQKSEVRSPKKVITKKRTANSKLQTEKMEVHHHPKESLQLAVGS
jgi:hypothetical protein